MDTDAAAAADTEAVTPSSGSNTRSRRDVGQCSTLVSGYGATVASRRGSGTRDALAVVEQEATPTASRRGSATRDVPTTRDVPVASRAGTGATRRVRSSTSSSGTPVPSAASSAPLRREARQRSSLGAAVGSAQRSSSAAADGAPRTKEEQEHEDALFAQALMEQDLREAAEHNARHEADAMVAAALQNGDREHRHRHRDRGSGHHDMMSYMHLAAAMSMAQAEADEQQRLQDILDESRRAMGEACDENEAFARIQRQSLLEAVRSQLPTTIWTAEQENGEQECALCLAEYAEGDEVTRLSCLHAFHRECLDPWLEKQSTCPVCKIDLLEGEPQELIGH